MASIAALLGEREPDLGPAGEGGGDALALLAVAAGEIDQRQVGGGIGETALLVLPVHGEQERRQALQRADRDRGIVDPGARAPLRAHLATDDELVRRRHSELPEQGSRRWRLRLVEASLDEQLVAAAAHRLGIGALAGEQLQRLHEQRLARAGLTGERGEPRRQVEVQRVDDPEIANVELSQHGRSDRIALREPVATGREA